ncbi:hypothetical protein MALU111345_17395 [Marinicrinis lubricantis]
MDRFVEEIQKNFLSRQNTREDVGIDKSGRI